MPSYMSDKKEPSSQDRVPSVGENDMEYSCFADVWTEVRDVLVVDLARHTQLLPVEFTDALLPEPPGVYMLGQLNPIVTFDPRNPLFSQKSYDAQKMNPTLVPDVHDFTSFLACNDTIVNLKGKVVAKSSQRTAKFYSDKCTYNYSAIYLLATEVWNLLSMLHRETHPTTNVGLNNLVRERYMVEDADSYARSMTTAHIGARTVLQQVLDFIGRDQCAVYTLRLTNTTLNLEKGNDFRVIEYYRTRFEEIEAKIIENYGFLSGV